MTTPEAKPTPASPLVDLAANTPARVVEVADGPVSTRLRAMGVCVGRTLELVRPGNPLIISVLGTRVGLAAEIARSVMVERLAEQPTPDAEAASA